MTGQTYSRKVDIDSLTVLASLGATVHKVNVTLTHTLHCFSSSLYNFSRYSLDLYKAMPFYSFKADEELAQNLFIRQIESYRLTGI